MSNVLWNWTGVAVSLIGGLVLTPYIIRKLGADGYGVWSLVFSLIGYYSLLDFGFRSAVVRFSAHYRAQHDSDKINELVNTLLFYFSAASILLLVVTVVLARYADRLFQIPAALRGQFSWLVSLVGINLAVGVAFNVFTGCVEGFQRFDLVNKIRVTAYSTQAVGCFVTLSLGYGLAAMGAVALGAQALLCLLYFVNFRRIFPALRFSRSLVTRSMFVETAGYGGHTFVASLASQSLEQTPSLIIGHHFTTAFVGFYNLPYRLLQYAADGVSRVGLVVAPQAAELAATDQIDKVRALGVYANRYCFALYTPLAITLLFYGRELFRAWVGIDYVNHSAPLLPVILIAAWFTLAGQFSSSTILFGLGKHRGYAWGLVAEALCNVGAMIIIVPRHGILGAAIAATSLTVAIRGIYTPWLLCRVFGCRLAEYLGSIFARPLLTAVPVMALTYAGKKWLWAGNNWAELGAVAVLVGGLYLGMAYFTCLEREHRRVLTGSALRLWSRLRSRMPA